MKESRARVLVRVGWGAAQAAVGLSAALLLVYFLGTSAAGRAVMGWAVEQELYGVAEFGNVTADPAGAAVFVTDFSLIDPESRPVLSVESLELVSEGLPGGALEKVRAAGGLLHVAVDDAGNVSLAQLPRPGKKKEKEEEEPEVPLSIRDLLLEDFRVLLTSPWAELAIGPVRVRGSLGALAGQPAGRVGVSLQAVHVTPVMPEAKDALAGLAGCDEMETGPLELRSHWEGETVVVDELRLAVPGATVSGSGRANLQEATGYARLVLTDEAGEAARIEAWRDGEEWRAGVRVDRLFVPALRIGESGLPQWTVSDLTAAVSRRNVESRLRSLAVDRLTLDDVQVERADLGWDVMFVSKVPLEEAGAALALSGSADDLLTAGTRPWQGGRAKVTLKVDRLLLAGKEAARPLALVAAVEVRPDGTAAVVLELEVSREGKVRLSGTLSPGKGGWDCRGRLEVAGLDTTPWLAAADLPGVLQRMLSGVFAGQLEFHFALRALPVVAVERCRFSLTGNAGEMRLACPTQEQGWDLSVSPSYSFFASEVTFGQGKLLVERPGSGRK